MDQEIKKARQKLAQTDGVQSVSVDGMSVTRQSAADKIAILEELKKSKVTKIPMFMARWK